MAEMVISIDEILAAPLQVAKAPKTAEAVSRPPTAASATTTTATTASSETTETTTRPS